MNISSDEKSTVVNLNHSKSDIHSHIQSFVSSVGNPIDENALEVHAQSEMLYNLSLMILGLHHSPSEAIVSTTLISDHVYLNSSLGEDDFHTSYRFLSTQIKTAADYQHSDNIKITYGGDLETFKELARRYIRGEPVIDFINSEMVIESMDMGSYANNFINFSRATDVFTPGLDLDSKLRKIKNEPIIKEIVSHVDSHSFTANPTGAIAKPIGAIDVSDMKHVSFTYETSYEDLIPIRDFFCPKKYSSPPFRTEASEEINMLAIKLGIKKSVPVEVDMFHSIAVSFGDPAEMDNFYMSAFELTQSGITRYFINFNFVEISWDPSHDNFNPEVSKEVFLEFLRDLKLASPLDHFTSKIEKKLLETKVALLRPPSMENPALRPSIKV